jgi:hypothetical protein
MDTEDRELAELEAALQSEFGFTSTAGAAKVAENVKEIIIPRSQRGRMPLSRSDYSVDENPALVEWEREVRWYIRNLRPSTRYKGHKINAVMIFETVTGKTIKQIQEEERVDTSQYRGGQANGSANMHLRLINRILKDYFGDPRKTTILGRPVGKAYDVMKGFRVERRKPMCIQLWPEFDAGILDKDAEED